MTKRIANSGALFISILSLFISCLDDERPIRIKGTFSTDHRQTPIPNMRVVLLDETHQKSEELFDIKTDLYGRFEYLAPARVKSVTIKYYPDPNTLLGNKDFSWRISPPIELKGDTIFDFLIPKKSTLKFRLLIADELKEGDYIYVGYSYEHGIQGQRGAGLLGYDYSNTYVVETLSVPFDSPVEIRIDKTINGITHSFIDTVMTINPVTDYEVEF